ncbi:glycosyltransferase [Salinibacter altiplanensis]|uniref:glycosyltransferase n=1 Tax=Salinibacter altiplanensis TaxID=1803181 RepID=UPI0018F89698|nr:glycosyltransferase [Salinibacter altiplanensis]
MPDRWTPYDRYPRQFVRELLYATGIRRRRPSGHQMVYQNLKKGLDRAGIPYRDNDFRYIRQHPDELMCIVGKPYLLFEYDWPNPIVFGASIFDHPVTCPDFWERHPNVQKMLVPGPWMYDMFTAHYPKDRLEVWPVGIDLNEWLPKQPSLEKPDRVLLYDKVRWAYDRYEDVIINPIRQHLKAQRIEIETLRYGHYFPEDLKGALERCRAVVFLCEHETQGIAYQQMLASDVPIFAWDRGGYWQDPNFFPDRVRYGPVSSVPYWDERCGMKFETADEFVNQFGDFWGRVQKGEFSPRDYVVENLTLEKCARGYADIAAHVRKELNETASVK